MATKYGRSIQRAQYPIRMKGSSRCPSHKNSHVVFLCQDCNILICTICSNTSHKKHVNSFVEISKTTNHRKHLLHDFVHDTDKIKIPKLNTEISTAKKEILVAQRKYKNLSSDIKRERDKCKLDLDKITEDYITICGRMEEATKDLFQTRITFMEERIDTLVKLSSECKETLRTDNAVLMYDSVSEIQDMDLDIPKSPTINMTEFTPGSNRRSHLEQAMGRMRPPTDQVQTEGTSSGPSKPGTTARPKESKSRETGQPAIGAGTYSPTVLSQFSYPDNITSICPTHDGDAWLSDCATNTVKLVTSRGQVIQKIQHNCCIQDISLDPITGRLWFCCKDERTINEVLTSSSSATRFVTEGRPDRLCATRVGRLVVVEEDITNPRIVMYTADGGVLHTTDVEGSGVWSVPSVTYCGITGNVAIVSVNLVNGDDNDTDFFRRHIIVYNFYLQPLFHYRGEGIPAEVTPDKFDPLTIVYDSKGNIVIADCTRNTIELISGAGRYIKTLNTNEGEQGPVGIQKEDVLWSRLLGKGKAELILIKYYSD